MFSEEGGYAKWLLAAHWSGKQNYLQVPCLLKALLVCFQFILSGLVRISSY